MKKGVVYYYIIENLNLFKLQNPTIHTQIISETTNIPEFLKILKETRKEEIEKTIHVEEQLKDRNIEYTHVLELLEKDSVGILKQNDNTFKLYYKDTDSNDMVIIISYRSEKLHLVTLFLHDIKRRVRYV